MYTIENDTRDIWLIFQEPVKNLEYINFFSQFSKMLEERTSRHVITSNSYNSAIHELDGMFYPSCVIIDGKTNLTFIDQLTQLVYTIREKYFYLPMLLISEKDELLKIPVPVLTKFDGYIWKDHAGCPSFENMIETVTQEFEKTDSIRQ